MGSAVSVLRPRAGSPPSPLSPDRAALAAAIVALREWRDEIAAVDAAVASARTAWRAAVDRRDAAAAAVETAREANAAHMTAVALGTAGTPPGTVRAARDALVDAEDHLAAAKDVMDALTERRHALPDLTWAKEKVRIAAAAVVRSSPEMAALLGDVQRLQNELAQKGAALLWLSTAAAGERPRDVDDANMRSAVSLLRQPVEWWPGVLRTPDGAEAWKQALAALQEDAGAPLPPLESVR